MSGGASGVAPRKRGRPTAAEREARRDDVLDAAVRLFAARGLGGVSLDEIAAEARVTKRTIYAYFGDRTEIFLAAVERLRRRTVPAADPRADGLEALAIHIVATLHSDEAVGLHRLMIIEAAAFPELAAGFYEEGPRAYIAALRERLPGGDGARAEALFSLLLGEPHRQRLLGLRAAPSPAAAAAHARAALASLSLGD